MIIRTSAGVRDDQNELYEPIHVHEVIYMESDIPKLRYVGSKETYHTHEIVPGQNKTTIVNGHHHTVRFDRPKRRGFE